MNLFDKTSYDVARTVIKNYSTSFYWSSLFFKRDIRDSIFAIYGFVRLADEIVDTFHDYDKARLLNTFESDLHQALKDGISLNPVLHAFATVVRRYDINPAHIDAFMTSMRYDLDKNVYNSQQEINSYIYGSAEVVGLMCLKVFCRGDQKLYEKLEVGAVKLGSAFQKVNFLRDLKDDMHELNRVYFPSISANSFSESAKKEIIQDIKSDFKVAFSSIKHLPQDAKLAVLIAYYYYRALLAKLNRKSATQIASERVRISNGFKTLLVLRAYTAYKLCPMV